MKACFVTFCFRSGEALDLGENPKKAVCYFNNVLAALLIWLQIARRLYECLFISTFSRSTMHLIHYAMGFFFYFTVVQMTLFDIYNANVVLRPSVFRHALISTPFLILALLCQVLQHGVLKQLAALRSGKFYLYSLIELTMSFLQNEKLEKNVAICYYSLQDFLSSCQVIFANKFFLLHSMNSIGLEVKLTIIITFS